MDGLIFRYFPAESSIHRFDPRFKLPAFALICFTVLRTDCKGIILPGLLVLLALFMSRIHVRFAAHQCIRFLPLIVMYFAAIFLSDPGTDRAAAAAMAALRFTLVILSGNLFIQTTSLKSISSAVRWYTKPVPLLKGGRIATMIGLTISLIPVFFNELEESKDALRARGLSPGKRPVRWTIVLVRPLLTRLFLATEATAEAMEARCYSDDRSSVPLKAGASDWIILGTVILGCSASFLL